jgi:hypothetical protein
MRAERLIALVALATACGGSPPSEPSAPKAAPATEAAGDLCSRIFETRRGDLVVLDADRRAGVSGARFSEQSTTLEQPIEVCGVPRQLDVLIGLRCDDGSSPFASRKEAHAARHGAAVSAGRCGKPVDIYEVPCPEGTHELHFDGYVCTAAELTDEGPHFTELVEQGFTAVIPIRSRVARTPWGVAFRGNDYSMTVITALDSTGFDVDRATAEARQAMGISVPAQAESISTSEGTLRRYRIGGGPEAVTVHELRLAGRPIHVILATGRRRADAEKLVASMPAMGTRVVTNEHEYLDREVVFSTEADDIELITGADPTEKPYVYPAGWKATVSSADNFMARIDTEDGSLSFIHQRLERAESPVDVLADVVGQSTVGERVVVLHRTAEHILVENGDGWTMTMVTVLDGGGALIGILTGQATTFRRLSGATLLLALESIMAGLAGGQPK